MKRETVSRGLAWSAWALVMCNALARAVIALDPFPHWDMDPTVVWSPTTGLGPTAALGLDLLALGGAGLALLSAALTGARVLITPVALLTAGAIPVICHSFSRGLLSPDDARIGVSWLAAGATAIALVHLCRDETMRRVTIAAAIGIIGMLAAKGALQVFVEHPQNVRNFKQNREAILGAHGWSSGSPMARGFERRLEQPEATGWFGLANVYATFAAASAVALLGLAVLAWRSARSAAQAVPDGIAAIVSLGAAASLFAVWLAGAKAGYAVTALGTVLLLIAWLGSRDRPGWLRVTRPILGGPLATVVIIAVLAAVLLRGAIGEAISEPSILFRWFYLQGATGVFLDHPLLGVGPDGFKDAYMVAKPAIAPESVESPHSVFFDYLAKLGIAGAGLAGLLFWLIWRSGAALMSSEPTTTRPGNPAPSRAEVWVVVAAAALPTLVSAWLESPITTAEAAAARAIGAAAWIGIGLACVWVLRAAGGVSACLAAAAIAAAAHAQIEMTPIQPASAALFMVLLGAAAAKQADGPARATRALLMVPGAVVVAGALVLIVALVPRAALWERTLHAAAAQVRPMAEIQARLGALSVTGPSGADSIEAIAIEIGRLLGRPAPTNDAELQGALSRLNTRCLDEAVREMDPAAALVSHQGTHEAISRLLLGRATASASLGDAGGARDYGDRAEAVGMHAAALFPDHAPAWGWLGTIRSTRATLEQNRDHLAAAIEAWKLAAGLDPHGLTYPLQIYRAQVALESPDEARVWGRRVLDADDRLRLDPLMRLDAAERASIQRVVDGGAP